MIPSVALTWRAVQNPAIGLEESEFLGLVLNHRLSNADSGIRQEYPEEIRLAAYLEKLHLRDGSVVVDNASSCVPGIITTIDNPKVFVIPNDRSYQRTLADPLTFRAHYILEADPLGTNSVTSINIAYPTLWSTGAGFARSVHTFRFTGQCRDFRLFKVFTHPTEAQTNAGTQA
jgi:sulfur carrier protein ThiS